MGVVFDYVKCPPTPSIFLRQCYIYFYFYFFDITTTKKFNNINTFDLDHIVVNLYSIKISCSYQYPCTKYRGAIIYLPCPGISHYLYRHRFVHAPPRHV